MIACKHDDIPSVCIDCIKEENEELKAERDRLREAAQPFANYACDDWETHGCHNCILKRALIHKEDK